METRKKKLGVDHPDTLTSMANLAFTLKSQGRDREAIALMWECVYRRQHVLGEGHPAFKSSATTLFQWKTEQGVTGNPAKV